MAREDKARRDPFEGLTSGEPVEDLGLTPTPVPSALAGRRARPGARKTPIRPSEKRRRQRFVGVTFSDADVPDRLRVLAEQWGMTTHTGQPNVSGLVEYLLLPQLEAAERGEIESPNEGTLT